MIKNTTSIGQFSFMSRGCVKSPEGLVFHSSWSIPCVAYHILIYFICVVCDPGVFDIIIYIYTHHVPRSRHIWWRGYGHPTSFNGNPNFTAIYWIWIDDRALQILTNGHTDQNNFSNFIKPFQSDEHVTQQCVCVCVCVCVFIYIYIYVYNRIFIYMYVYIYIYTCIYTQ